MATQQAKERLGRLTLGSEVASGVRQLAQATEDAKFNARMTEADIFYSKQPAILGMAYGMAADLDQSQSTAAKIGNAAQIVSDIGGMAAVGADLAFLFGGGVGGVSGQYEKMLKVAGGR